MAGVKQLKEERKIIKKLNMSEQQEMQPESNLCMANKIISGQKKQMGTELMANVEMDLDAKRKCITEYNLGYTMTVKVRFACTQ
jgi:hypothetical protein